MSEEWNRDDGNSAQNSYTGASDSQDANVSGSPDENASGSPYTNASDSRYFGTPVNSYTNEPGGQNANTSGNPYTNASGNQNTNANADWYGNVSGNRYSNGSENTYTAGNTDAYTSANASGSPYTNASGNQYTNASGSQYGSGSQNAYTNTSGNQYTNASGSQYGSGSQNAYTNTSGNQYTNASGSQYGSGSQNAYTNTSGNQYTNAYGNQYTNAYGNPYAGGSDSHHEQPEGNGFTMPGYQAPGTDVTRYGERENTSYDSYQFSQQPAAGGSGKPPKKKSDVWKKIGIGAAIAGVCALVAALVFLGVSLLGNKITGSSSHGTSSTATTSKPETGSTGQNKTPGSTESKADESKGTTSSSDTGTAVTNTSGDMSIEQVAADAMPSMVAITTKTVQQVQSYITGQTQEYQATAEGSGIIVGKTDSELLIATNNHVITGSETISVAFVDNSVASGEIKGANSDEDLAVVAVKLSDLSSDTQSKVSVIDIGSSDDCKVGESVVAIGNALGYGQSVSSGIVSALNRTVTVDNVKHTLIQTDAAINPGNSGGALLNMKGELIGINEVKYADTTVEGMGYAIPISTAEPILNKLMNKSDRQKVDDANASYLGVSVVTMPTTYVQQGYPAGAYVSAVVSGQAADKAGIQEGDIITAIDGYSVTSADELVGELTYYAQGTTIDFSVSRLNSSQTAFETQTISVTLGSKADAPAAGSTNSSSSADSSTSGTGNGQTPFGSSQGGTIQPGNGQTGGTTQPGNGLQGS